MTDYGTDFLTIVKDGVIDIDPSFRTVSGPMVVAYALLRRFSTPKGKLRRHPTYGEDLRAYLHEGMTSQDLALLQRRVAEQAEQDERVYQANATVTLDRKTQTMRVKVFGVLANGSSFDHVFTVTSDTIKLITSPEQNQ